MALLYKATLGQLESRPARTTVQGSGKPGTQVPPVGGVELVVARVVAGVRRS